MGSFAMPVAGKISFGRLTQNAGTKIVRLIPGRDGLVPQLLSLTVSVSTTAHILTVLRPLNYTTLSAANAASDTVINLTADPGDFDAAGTYQVADNPIAASDWVAFKLADGTWHLDTVASVSTLAITLTTGLPSTVGATAGEKVWFFGVETDSNPNAPHDGNSQAHPRYNLPASTTVVLGDTAGEAAGGWQGALKGVLSGMTDGKGQPLLLVIDNGSNASTIQETTAFYSDRA